MKRLKGPKLTMPDLKVPPFLADLYWDLRDRRLLPLIGVVVVAIVAVPFLLGGESEEPSPAPARAGASAVAPGPAGVDSASLTVVQAKPGLRDYRKRLARRKPTDPFKQRYTGPVLKGAKLNEQTESSSTSTTETTTTTETETGTTITTDDSDGASPGQPSPSGKGKPHLTFFTFAINVRISKSAGKDADAKEKQEPSVKHRVLPLTPLPGEKAPVVTYMGQVDGATKALLLVSNDVQSVFGEAKCVSGDDVCQLLKVEPGFPVTFVYGVNEVRYTINVLKIEPVITGRS